MAFTPVSPINRPGGQPFQQAQHPYNAQIQALIRQFTGGAGGGGIPMPGYHPAPGGEPRGFPGPGQVPPAAPGVPPVAPPAAPPIDGGYNPAQFRLSQGNTAQAFADWQAHHSGNALNHPPQWVANYEAQQLQNGEGGHPIDPGARLHDVINFHRQSNGLPHMQPEELHQRVTSLAHELLNGRHNRLQKSLRRIRPGGRAPGNLSELMAPPAPAQTLAPPGQNYS